MARVIYAMLIIAIEDFKTCMNNSHLPIEKSAIYYDLSFQKESNSRNNIFTITSYLWLFKSDKSWTFLIITVYKYRHID